MNKIASSVVAWMAMALLVGCGTMQPQKLSIRQEAADWTALATGLALAKAPQYRPALEMAAKRLDVAVQGGGISGAVLTDALGGLKELQSTDARLALFGGDFLLHRLGLTSASPPEALGEAMAGVRDGLFAGLGLPPPRAQAQ